MEGKGLEGERYARGRWLFGGAAEGGQEEDEGEVFHISWLVCPFGLTLFF